MLDVRRKWSKAALEGGCRKQLFVMCVDFPGGSDGKVSVQCGRPGFNPWVGTIPWRRKRQPTPVLLPRKSHGWRSLVQATVHGVSESQTRLSETLLLKNKPFFCALLSGGRHASSLQYSCLENPMDRRDWWTTVHRVAKSQTRLKQPSIHTLCNLPLSTLLFLSIVE